MTQTDSRLAAALADRYTIERQLGAGGMATVYLAHDVRHDRRVAVKVLKPELAAVLGADRFIVEIKTTAALQHPHILPLFDSGTADGFLYYVMPYVEGETLRAKLDRETQLGIDESVRIVSDVADALDYAHRHGVIHRDIKPENILLHDGRPVVADFGIALAVSAAAGGRMTETGLSLGTPHYMSPEQATADKDITARSDVYSLASVLYEMLTGDPPHVGASAQQIIMKIVTEEAPPVTKVRKSVPSNIAAAIAKALEKLPADRFASAAELRDALKDPHFAATTSAANARQSTARSRSRREVALGALAIVAIAAAIWGWSRGGDAHDSVLRYRVVVPSSPTFPLGTPTPVPLPDGSGIVYNGPGDGNTDTQLWIKRRDDDGGVPIPGTGGAGLFAIAPDGRSIAFAAGSQLRRIPLAGGVPVTLVAQGVATQLGIAWTDDNRVVFSRVGRSPGLASVPADGGNVTMIWQNVGLVGLHPQPLPGGKGLLFAACSAPVQDACELQGMRAAGDSSRRLLSGTAYAQYSPTGHLVYSTRGQLYAIAFDADRMEVSGAPIALDDSLSTSIFAGVRLSPSGVLVTQRAESGAMRPYQLVWIDRTGRETPLDTSWAVLLTLTGTNHGWAISPDGRQLAIGLSTDAGDDIYVKQLPRGPASRVSFGATSDFRPRWTPDGRSLTFISTPQQPGVYQRRADGSGTDSLLVAGAFDEAVYTPDGTWLLLRQGAAGSVAGGRDITGMRVGRDTAPVPVLVTPFDEDAIAVSPNSRWLAYQSDEGGRTEVFIRSFPNTSEFKRQVSTEGGVSPVWSRDGSELFYLAADRTMMAVRFTDGSPPTIGDPAPLFAVASEFLQVESAFYTPWDVAPDGRFLMARTRLGGPGSATIVVAENWLTEFKQKLRR